MIKRFPKWEPLFILFFLTLRQSITDANSTNINNQNEKTNEEKKFTTLLDKHCT